MVGTVASRAMTLRRLAASTLGSNAASTSALALISGRLDTWMLTEVGVPFGAALGSGLVAVIGVVAHRPVQEIVRAGQAETVILIILIILWIILFAFHPCP